MIKVTEKHINEIREIIKNYSGIVLDRLHRNRVEKRIKEQMKQLNCHNADDYIELLKSHDRNPVTMDDFISSSTINESYLFRNPKQFEYLLDNFFPNFFRSKGYQKPLRIWSAGCSRGEEAYSIAIIAKKYKEIDSKAQFAITAGDISKKNLEQARTGNYSSNSIRNEKEDFEQKLGFSIGEYNFDGTFTISQDIKDIVNFVWLNLKDTGKLKIMYGYDVIFCRNVLIYFDEHLRNKLIQIFFESLNPGGLLFIGQSECFPFPENTFVTQNNYGSYVYRKPEKN